MCHEDEVFMIGPFFCEVVACTKPDKTVVATLKYKHGYKFNYLPDFQFGQQSDTKALEDQHSPKIRLIKEKNAQLTEELTKRKVLNAAQLVKEAELARMLAEEHRFLAEQDALTKKLAEDEVREKAQLALGFCMFCHLKIQNSSDKCPSRDLVYPGKWIWDYKFCDYKKKIMYEFWDDLMDCIGCEYCLCNSCCDNCDNCTCFTPLICIGVWLLPPVFCPFHCMWLMYDRFDRRWSCCNSRDYGAPGCTPGSHKKE